MTDTTAQISEYSKIILFIRNETVLCIASILAIFSAFMVPPSTEYIGYIDFRVLGLLFCLMIVVAGIQSLGMFERITNEMLKYISTTRSLAYMLVMLCFFSSMLITNDVALITFVPFAIMIIQKIRREKMMIIVIVMQTVAANLGSMFTPLGNPQNLYLYSISGMGIIEFLKLMFPFTILSFGGLVVMTLFIKNEKIEIAEQQEKISKTEKTNKMNFIKGSNSVLTTMFVGLFSICILSVLHIIDFRITLVTVVVVIWLINRQLFASVDYMLLITFVAFFVFVGNMKNIPYIENILAGTVSGNEIIVSIMASQVISNVPASILLSGFTSDYGALIVGSNVGGLGTLIASMASLISYKFYVRSHGADKCRYFIAFTLINVLFLSGLLLEYMILKYGFQI